MKGINMKKFLSLIVVTLIIFTASGINNTAKAVRNIDCTNPKYERYCEQNGIENPEIPEATCNKKRTTCSIGNYRMHSNNSQKPLYVSSNGRIVCNYTRTKCTDGYFYKKSSKPMY